MKQHRGSGAVFVYLPSLIAYAYSGGSSDQPRFSESLRIIRNNDGTFWMMLKLRGAMKMFPFLKRLRPYQDF